VTNGSNKSKGSSLGSVGIWLLSYGPAILTILGSTAVALGASFMRLSEIQILQAVVVLVALIGTSLLSERLIEGRRVREKLREMNESLDRVLIYARNVETMGLDNLIIRRRDLPPLEERLSGAKHVSISGGSLFRLVNEYRSLFEQLIESGCHLRFLLTDPDAPGAESLSSAVVYESNDVESYRHQMRVGVAWLTNLASRFPQVCQVKLFALAPPFSIVSVEKGDNSSSIQVELYPFRLPARDRPMFQLDKHRNPRLHTLFSSQFEAMWDSKFSRSPDTTQSPGAARSGG
jgi:hypothetical protein